jgi:hypothetical protein
VISILIYLKAKIMPSSQFESEVTQVSCASTPIELTEVGENCNSQIEIRENYSHQAGDETSSKARVIKRLIKVCVLSWLVGSIIAVIVTKTNITGELLKQTPGFLFSRRFDRMVGITSGSSGSI